MRDHLTREQFVGMEGGGRGCPVVAEQQEGAEAARAVQQVLDVGDGVGGGADAAIAACRIVFHELVGGRGRSGVIGERHEAGRAEVVGEVLQAVGAVLDGLLAGVGEVDDAQHPPVVPVRFGPAGFGGLVAHRVPGGLDGGVATGHRHRQGEQGRAQCPRQSRPRWGNHCRGGNLGIRPGVGADMQGGVAQGEPVGLAVDPLVGCGAEQRQDRLQRLLHHRPLVHRVDAHHVGVGRQRARPGAEHHPAAGEVVEQHPAVGDHERMVVGQGHHPGAQPDVSGPFGRGGDEHLGTRDEFVTAGMVFAEPGLVVAEPVQRLDAVHVVLQCGGGGLTHGVEGGDEHTEIQRTHLRPPRNSSSAAFTSSGRSCCSQCPAPSSSTSR